MNLKCAGPDLSNLQREGKDYSEQAALLSHTCADHSGVYSCGGLACLAVLKR